MLNYSTCPISFLALAAQYNATEIATIEHNLEKHAASSVLIASLLLAGALVVLLAGAKLVKPTLFLTGFGTFFVAGLLGVDATLAASPGLSALASCILLGATPVLLGLFGSLLALCVLKVGLAVLGAAAGAGSGYVVYNAALIRIAAMPALVGSHDFIFVCCLVLGAVLGIALLLKFQESVLIAASAAAGAAACTPNIALLLAHANVKVALPGSQYAWAQALATLVLFAVGLAVQCRGADKKRKEATETVPARRRLSTPLMSP